MTNYKIKVKLPKNSIFEQLEGMTGKQCYDRFGLKEDECQTITVKFSNGLQADIKMCVCDEDYTCFSEGILFNQNGGQIALTEPADSVIGEWLLEDDDNNSSLIC